jgi:hypothetical protein
VVERGRECGGGNGSVGGWARGGGGGREAEGCQRGWGRSSAGRHQGCDDAEGPRAEVQNAPSVPPFHPFSLKDLIPSFLVPAAQTPLFGKFQPHLNVIPPSLPDSLTHSGSPRRAGCVAALVLGCLVSGGAAQQEVPRAIEAPTPYQFNFGRTLATLGGTPLVSTNSPPPHPPFSPSNPALALFFALVFVLLRVCAVWFVGQR